MMNKKYKNLNSGTSVIELVFYVSILAILVLVVINSIIMMTRSFRETTVQTTLESAGSVMERMSREIKQASAITTLTTSRLVIVSKDINGNDENVEFVLSGTNINFLQNGSSSGNLNSTNLAVNSLSFTQITTSKGTAVKIAMTVQSNSDILNRTVDFYDTVVLRGDY